MRPLRSRNSGKSVGSGRRRTACSKDSRKHSLRGYNSCDRNQTPRPMKIFFLGLGGSASSEAARINTVNYYFPVINKLNDQNQLDNKTFVESSCPPSVP